MINKEPLNYEDITRLDKFRKSCMHYADKNVLKYDISIINSMLHVMTLVLFRRHAIFCFEKFREVRT